MYTFKSDIQCKLASNNLKYETQQIWMEQVWPKLFYLIRVSFSVMLLVSLVVVFSTIAFISSSSSDDC